MKLLSTLPYILIFCFNTKIVNCLPTTTTSLDSSSSLEVPVPGGLSSQDIPANVEIKKMIDELSPKIKTFLVGVPGGRNIIMGTVEPVSYKTQLVNGVNYFVKVTANTSRKTVYYHLRIYKSFNGQAQLVKVDGPKRQSDSIKYF